MRDRTRFDGLGGAGTHRKPEAERARGTTLRRVNTLRRRFGLGEIGAEQADRMHTLDLGRELARLEARLRDEDGGHDGAHRHDGRCDQLRFRWKK